MLVIGAIGLRLGKWQRLLYGTDYQGEVHPSNARWRETGLDMALLIAQESRR